MTKKHERGEIMKEKQLAKMRKNNMKLYPMYRIVGADWIFYYGIEILFLTQVKNISPANIILSGSVYSFCYIIFQLFSMILVEKIGKKKCIVLGQSSKFLAMLIIFYCPNFLWLLVSSAIKSIGDSFKAIAESSLLNASIPNTKKKGDIFSKIDGRGYSKYCYVGATSLLISGFLYSINPYIPIVLCLIANFLAIAISANFVDIEKITDNTENKRTIKEETIGIVKDLKESFKFMLTSKRLKALLLMIGVIWGIIAVYAKYQETLLKELNIPSYYIGFMLAGFQMLVGVFATKSNKFNKKYKNHTLTYIGLMLTLGSIALGIATILNIPFEVQLMIITFVFILRAYAKGLFQVLKNRYTNNFADNKILPKIYSARGITSNLGKGILGLIASAILNITTLPYAMIIMGVICLGIVGVLAIYSKSRLGLKPEEYSKKDISYAGD